MALSLLLPTPVTGQEARLGGGSDISAGSVVDLPRGSTIAPVHHLFADNPESHPIAVAFRTEAPAGITITPEREHVTIPPGEGMRVRFSIAVADAAAPGEHRVTVQLVRTDIEAKPGHITSIPAIGTSFTIRVRGEAAAINVRAVNAQNGRPVEGTLTLGARTGPNAFFEVARQDGSELQAKVAPGDYRAAYLLAGREMAAEEVRVGPDETAAVRLEVDTVSFVTVAAKPVKEGDRIAVAELVAAVENHLAPMAGPAAIRAHVQHDRKRLETVTLQQLDDLKLGVTEAKLTYRPARGFVPGEYRFVFELTTPQLTLRAAKDARFTAERGPSLALVLAYGTVGLAVGFAVWVFRRRRGRKKTSPNAAKTARVP
jgi:hypothetical protein